MLFSDLHIHSTYSDGILAPTEIISVAEKKNIHCISITDHDTVESQYVLQDSCKFNGIIVPGVELSTEYRNREIHILGYFIDIYDSNLKIYLDKIKDSRIERAKSIIYKLKEVNIDIDFEDINYSACLGRPHIAKILVEKGFANNTKEAFQQYLIKGKPGYVDRYKISYKEALKLITASNGLAILAHPGEIYKGILIEDIIREFKVYGLGGIEVFHPSHSDRQVNDYYNLAKKYSMVITGGSDCHGIMIDNDLLIGTKGINENLTNKFLKNNLNRFEGSIR